MSMTCSLLCFTLQQYELEQNQNVGTISSQNSLANANTFNKSLVLQK